MIKKPMAANEVRPPEPKGLQIPEALLRHPSAPTAPREDDPDSKRTDGALLDELRDSLRTSFRDVATIWADGDYGIAGPDETYNFEGKMDESQMRDRMVLARSVLNQMRHLRMMEDYVDQLWRRNSHRERDYERAMQSLGIAMSKGAA